MRTPARHAAFDNSLSEMDQQHSQTVSSVAPRSLLMYSRPSEPVLLSDELQHMMLSVPATHLPDGARLIPFSVNSLRHPPRISFARCLSFNFLQSSERGSQFERGFVALAHQGVPGVERCFAHAWRRLQVTQTHRGHVTMRIVAWVSRRLLQLQAASCTPQRQFTSVCTSSFVTSSA